MSPRGLLTALQAEVLDAFFAEEQGYFLTGGAALAGYHLKHRETSDLDLFALDDDAPRRGGEVLGRLAERLGLARAQLRTSPDFVRTALSRGDTEVVVDLVRDRSLPLHPDKLVVGAVRLDPLDEILANKLTTLVSRQEERDVIDVMFIERRGMRVEDHLAAAARKDGGCTPATIAWLLDSWAPQLPADSIFAAGVRGSELAEYMAALAGRLRRSAFPAP